MNRRVFLRFALTAFVLLTMAQHATAACVNRFVSRSEQAHQIVTLLTGKLTFQEAQTLAAAIKAKQSPVFEWLDDGGKLVAKQFGNLKIVRPMPVGCDGKSSGVVIIVDFPTNSTPVKKMKVKLSADTTVTFDQQAN